MKKLIILFFFLFCGCNFASAASVEIYNAKPQDIINEMKKRYIIKGSIIDDVTDYSLVIKERNPVAWVSILYDSRIGSHVVLKSVYNFAPDGNNTIVNANFFIVQNDSNAFTVEHPLNEKDTQTILNQLQRKFNGYYSYGFDINKNLLSLTVIDVVKPEIGLKDKDKIKKINDVSVFDIDFDTIEKLIYPDSEKSITLEVKYKGGGKKTITLNSYFVESILKKNKK